MALLGRFLRVLSCPVRIAGGIQFSIDDSMTLVVDGQYQDLYGLLVEFNFR